MSEATPFDPNTWIPPVQETAKERAWRRFTEEPLVPLGCGATVVALLLASNSMRKGDRAKFNVWLRWRVAAQGLTVLAAVGGSVYYAEGKRNKKQLQDLENVRYPPMPSLSKQTTTSPKAQLKGNPYRKVDQESS